ncbi:Denticleless protein-like protein [Dichanthelium oligosanthes]|uniref:Denticleless protein-like protein n=1 Tax=Dichanthelium oligosanthes TaxID=888268 RepID=A0A1E5VHM3_9POAL|nr:Denticleless protein-like protein [Dichanthelium oligosanthes]
MSRRRLSPTFFGGLRYRELGGAGGSSSSRGAARLPYLADLSSDPGGRGGGVIAVEHSGDPAIPFAISFGKTAQTSNLLAVADEDGYVGLYDTRRRLPSRSLSLEKSAETRVSDWFAHNNAIFDVCWIKEGSQILTASGDQTVKIWSVGNRKCIGVLSGHTGSVKSLACHSSNPELIVSGSRDGSFALWDLRCDPKSPNNHGETCLMSSAVVREAHSPIQRSRTRSRAKAASTSITSVLYLKDDVSIATSGAADKIYLYSVLHVNKGPVKVYTGSKIESFFVKSAISPDGNHILGGSSDGNVYLWQVDQPESDPIILKGHEGEAASVDWCASEVGMIATSSDDSTVRVWSTRKIECTNVSSPTAIRKRITAPNTEYRRSATHERATTSWDVVACTSTDGKSPSGSHSPLQPRALDFGTPESAKKRGFALFQEEALDARKSPEAQMNSPSSVLSPPPSLKRRTIRDYFASSGVLPES